jgi:hypothetical protein
MMWSIGGMAIGWGRLKGLEKNQLQFHFVRQKSTKIMLGLNLRPP